MDLLSIFLCDLWFFAILDCIVAVGAKSRLVRTTEFEYHQLGLSCDDDWTDVMF